MQVDRMLQDGGVAKQAIQRFVDGSRIDCIGEDRSPNNATAKVARFFTIDKLCVDGH